MFDQQKFLKVEYVGLVYSHEGNRGLYMYIKFICSMMDHFNHVISISGGKVSEYSTILKDRTH